LIAETENTSKFTKSFTGEVKLCMYNPTFEIAVGETLTNYHHPVSIRLYYK